MQVFVRNQGFESNLADARNFSMGDPNVICRILSDYLYSNKIGSIVRELSANAIDAHRLGGCLDKPFEVHVPGVGEGLFDVNDSDFSIRDFGPGLSEQGIYDLYTSYGASSKREDQEQIGGFGIGSKSPFAYTKAFEVVSWHKGRKAQYICFQDEGGSPCVKKLHEEDSDEPSGIRVKFAVDDESECRRFRSECQFQYAWFNPKPSCNAVIPDLKPIYENECGVCYSSSQVSPIAGLMPGGRYSNGECHALVNGSIYSLGDMYSRRTFPSQGYASMPFMECWCILKIDGADVDVSASREELAFTDRTEEAVKKAYRKFFNLACKELWDEMHKDAANSLFEASWKWRSKNINVLALVNWAQSQGFESGCWNFGHANQMILQYIPLKSSVIWNFLSGGGRGYELSRKQSSSSGFSALSKMTKDVFSKEDNCKITVSNFRHISCDQGLSSKTWHSNCKLELYLAGCEDFRLAFTAKGTKFSDIKDRTRELAENLGRGAIVHVYAVSSEDERERIIKAYGSPDESRIASLDEALAPKPRKKRSNAAIEKRELVRTKVSSLKSVSSIYGAHELLYAIRINGKEQWMPVEGIQNRIAAGAVLLVLDGTSFAEEMPKTFETLLEFSSRVAGRGAIPFEWITMNAAAYRKYLSLGGKKVEEDDALKAASRLVESFGISAEDFCHWALAVCMDDDLNFGSINSACDFLAAASGHEDSPAVKAFARWKTVQEILSRNFSNTDNLARNLYGYRGRMCSVKTEKEIRESARKAMEIDEILKWLERNPILNLLRNRYSASGDKERISDIIGKYLVW